MLAVFRLVAERMDTWFAVILLSWHILWCPAALLVLSFFANGRTRLCLPSSELIRLARFLVLVIDLSWATIEHCCLHCDYLNDFENQFGYIGHQGLGLPGEHALGCLCHCFCFCHCLCHCLCHSLCHCHHCYQREKSVWVGMGRCESV